jgi:hypothetical protein
MITTRLSAVSPARHNGSEEGTDMKESRRDFVKTSIAFWTLTVTKTIAQPGSPATTTKTIGFLVSTKEKDKHDAAFQQALTDDNWTSNTYDFKPLSASDDYDVTNNNTLKTLARLHITKVDLIVAAGGLPTATAVAWAVTNYMPNSGEPSKPPPFVFLIGRYPQSNASVDQEAADLYNCSRTYKVGGVDQAVPAQNGANFQQLKEASKNSNNKVTLDNVGLIVNNNNPITPAEVDTWNKLQDPSDPSKRTNSNFIYPITYPNNQNQGISNLLASIENAKPQPNGIVVSSDPYLREVGNKDFDAQLRDSTTPKKGGHFTGWVCYPYQEYVLASGQSMNSTTTPMLYTDDPNPKIYKNTAYYQLGVAAAAILDQLKNNQPLNAGLTTWDGTQWKTALSFP